MLRIDTRLHAIPAVYREALKKAGIAEAGGRAMPEWSAASTEAEHRRGGARARRAARRRSWCATESGDAIPASDLSSTTPADSFYFDTALSSSAAALPTLQDYPGLDQVGRDAIDRNNALALFPRLGTGPRPAVVRTGLPARVRGEIRRRAIRLMAGAISKAR